MVKGSAGPSPLDETARLEVGAQLIAGTTQQMVAGMQGPSRRSLPGPLTPQPFDIMSPAGTATNGSHVSMPARTSQATSFAPPGGSGSFAPPGASLVNQAVAQGLVADPAAGSTVAQADGDGSQTLRTQPIMRSQSAPGLPGRPQGGPQTVAISTTTAPGVVRQASTGQAVPQVATMTPGSSSVPSPAGRSATIPPFLQMGTTTLQAPWASPQGAERSQSRSRIASLPGQPGNLLGLRPAPWAAGGAGRG